MIEQKQIQSWQIESYKALSPSYNLPKENMAFCPSNNLPKNKKKDKA